jgi:hypothetical protein
MSPISLKHFRKSILSPPRRYSGTSLRLAICKQMVKLTHRVRAEQRNTFQFIWVETAGENGNKPCKTILEMPDREGVLMMFPGTAVEGNIGPMKFGSQACIAKALSVY